MMSLALIQGQFQVSKGHDQVCKRRGYMKPYKLICVGQVQVYKISHP